MKIHASQIKSKKDLVDAIMQGDLHIDVSTSKPEAFVCRANCLSDVMASNEFEQLITKWLAVDIECCDARDAVSELLRAEVERQVNLVCEKWGVE
ncbi:hypothetical protein TW1_051 [Pseudoalteromonas phage TW1]|uniref:hypothetical protein n=1 Tax=Pseudoalteromonas phage TW1 TaxID=1366055 RepID=UPI00035AB43F|nr:hypothetical protein PP585_gp51 [Pseudoalteromonas phage TW1]AGR46567.1 hypothetical protein TW1_051 [Pseudoalteromonas phage TW1]